MCGRRQFFNGSCHNADAKCSTFNPLGGQCFTCANVSQTPVDGACPDSAVVKVCALGTYKKGGKCIPINCSGVDASGDCNGCSSVMFEIVSGRCALKTCPAGQALDSKTGNCVFQCSSIQQMIRGICYNLPGNCLRLAPHLSCDQCESGFEFMRGACVSAGGALNLP